MAVVFIPPQLRDVSGGETQVILPGENVRQIVAGLEQRFPGISARLCTSDGESLAPGLAVSVDGVLSSRGLYAKVLPSSEVHFLPAIGGG